MTAVPVAVDAQHDYGYSYGAPAYGYEYGSPITATILTAGAIRLQVLRSARSRGVARQLATGIIFMVAMAIVKVTAATVQPA